MASLISVPPVRVGDGEALRSWKRVHVPMTQLEAFSLPLLFPRLLCHVGPVFFGGVVWDLEHGESKWTPDHQTGGPVMKTAGSLPGWAHKDFINESPVIQIGSWSLPFAARPRKSF